MKTILQLAIASALIYLIVTRFVPWLQSQGEGLGRTGSRGGMTDSACVDSARIAIDSFLSEVRRFEPPIDIAAWNDLQFKLDGRISIAEDRCSCAEPSCESGSLALARLRSLIGDYDSGFRRGDGPPLNAASAVDEVFDSINLAAAQAREGN